MSKPERPARRARRALNLSQERFAELLGTSYNVVQRWESGKTTPSAPIRALLEILIARPKMCLEVLQPDETVSLPTPPPLTPPAPPPSEDYDPTIGGRTPVASSGFTALDATLPPPEPVDETKFAGDGGPPPGHLPPAQEGYDPNWGNIT